MKTNPTFSQPTGHEKIAEMPGNLLVPAPLGPADVSLTSKSIKSVPLGEKSPDTAAYAASLNVDEIADIKLAPAMVLRQRFKAEANSHRNRKAEAKRNGKPFSPAISDFRDFLLLIGPMPQPGMTLDRIDNDDPEYAPGKVRWATKKVQNNNKGDTSVFTLSANGMKFTASQLAEHFGLTTDAIRKRFERGWTHDEIILGKRQSTEPEPKPKKSGYSPEPVTKFPAGLYAGEQLANLNRCETRLRDPRAIRFHREAHAHHDA